jgi:hypothetical protein
LSRRNVAAQPKRALLSGFQRAIFKTICRTVQSIITFFARFDDIVAARIYRNRRFVVRCFNAGEVEGIGDVGF